MNRYLKILVAEASATKYTRWYISLINKALARFPNPDEYMEKHHILPKCFKLGGERETENLVRLTPREHLVVHQILPKMFAEDRRRRLLFAYWAMASLFSGKRRDVGKHRASAIEALREAATGRVMSAETRAKISIAGKGKQVGALNPMFGKVGPLHHSFRPGGKTLGKRPPVEERRSLKGLPSPSPPWDALRREKHRQQMRGSGNYNAKTWAITNITTGKVDHTSDLKDYCLNRGWEYQSLMSQKSRGKPYKGHSLTLFSDDENALGELCPVAA